MRSGLKLPHHCVQRVDGQCHALNMHLPLNLDLRQVLRRVRDQLGHIQVNAKAGYVENQLPRELLLEFLQLGDEVQKNE